MVKTKFELHKALFIGNIMLILIMMLICINKYDELQKDNARIAKYALVNYTISKSTQYEKYKNISTSESITVIADNICCSEEKVLQYRYLAENMAMLDLPLLKKAYQHNNTQINTILLYIFYLFAIFFLCSLVYYCKYVINED